MDTDTQLSFAGTEEDKTIAAQAFEVMKRKGILFAANAPIRMTVEGIAKALTKAGGVLEGQDPTKLAPKIEGALLKNEAVFARSENGEFVTTKSGHAYRVAGSQAASHTFKERLNADATALNADAAKEYAESLIHKAAARSDRPVVADALPEMPSMPSITPLPHTPHITFEHTTVIPQHLMPQPVVEAPREAEEPRTAPSRPAEAAASAAPAVQAPVVPATPAPPIPEAPAPPVTRPAEQAPATARTAPEPPVVRPDQVPATPAVEPQFVDTAVVREAPTLETAPQPAPVQAPAQPPVAETPVVQAPATPVTPVAPVTAVPKTAPVEAPAKPAPAAPVFTGPVEVDVLTENGPVAVDLRETVDDILADETLTAALMGLMSTAVQDDSRIVRFGSDVFPEEAVERFSKGDFRRIKDFLTEPETGGVASDGDIMDYVLNRRAEHPDYERVRFSLDYRLLKEKKDFEFVGTDTNRLWMEAGTVPVASPKRKPAEIGQDYRYLEDPAVSSVEDEQAEAVIGPLTYSLSYYEYENGVLPYDRRAKNFFAGPVFDDQRTSLLQFEIPQLYTSVLAELRFPTGNRGGFIMGLADFFTEHMVPGARFEILPTDRADNIFELHFGRHTEEERNLLQYDDRRQRYVFRPVSFTVDTDPSMLLTQEKFGKLHNQKRLEESERKRPDVILTNAFEAIGEQMDARYWAILDDLYPVVNLDRPMSRTWLITLLSGAYPFFYPDENTEGAYFYDPSKRPS